jgi:branched-chain amino acid transport system ATP-binding protein
LAACRAACARPDRPGRIFETIRRISAKGVTILLVEQNAKLALEISHRGYVMESGRIVLADAAPALLNNSIVQRAYLGG